MKNWVLVAELDKLPNLPIMVKVAGRAMPVQRLTRVILARDGSEALLLDTEPPPVTAPGGSG